MSYLFYVGIIIPTIITIVLFVVFIYCWFLQKARKEVLTKKYDPHGKMRRLGISFDPPPPPDYCRLDDARALMAHAAMGGLAIGEENEGYDVSRSPSTEQDARGRPLYHTYHDSGISAGLTGLSPMQEEVRRGFSYRSCPDSGISGFSAQQSSSSAHCLVQNMCHGCGKSASSELLSPSRHHHHQQQQPLPPLPPLPRQPLQQLQLGNEIQIHYQEPQQVHYDQVQDPCFQYDANFQQTQQNPQQLHLQQHLPQAMLHQNLMSASAHPSHGVCYGDDMTHPQSPQHYNSQPLHPSSLSLQHQIPFGYEDRLSFLHRDLSPSSPPPSASEAAMQVRQDLAARRQSTDRLVAMDMQNCMHPSDIQLQMMQDPSSPVKSPRAEHFVNHYPIQNIQSPIVVSHLQRQDPPPMQDHYYERDSILETTMMPQSQTTPMSSSRMTPHSYRDSGISDIGRSVANTSSDRPDSQASQSSTTDSEDSGFRSSHCAAHHVNQLSKQGNPLLKPFRRTRNNNSNGNNTRNKTNKRTSRNSSSNSDDSSPNGARSLTLNPQNLALNLNNPDVIQTTSMINSPNFQKGSPTSCRGSQHNPGAIVENENNLSISPDSPLKGIVLSTSKVSPVHSTHPSNLQHSPIRENWTSQSVNDQELHAKQSYDMTDISTHLSWKYVQDISSSSSSSSTSIPQKSSPVGAGGRGVGGMMSYNQSLGPGTLRQNNSDQPGIETLGFSVV